MSLTLHKKMINRVLQIERAVKSTLNRIARTNIVFATASVKLILLIFFMFPHVVYTFFLR